MMIEFQLINRDKVGSCLDVGIAETDFFGGKTLTYCPRGFALRFIRVFEWD